MAAWITSYIKVTFDSTLTFSSSSSSLPDGMGTLPASPPPLHHRHPPHRLQPRPHLHPLHHRHHCPPKHNLFVTCIIKDTLSGTLVAMC